MRMRPTVVVSVVVAVALLLTLFVPRAAAQGAPSENGIQILSVTPVDTNANGLYDMIRVTFLVNVTAEGNFEFLTEVLQYPLGPALTTAYRDVNLTAGSHNLTMTVLGPSLYLSGINGPYDIHVDAYAVDDDGIFWDQGAINGGSADSVTPGWDHASFDPPWAHLGGPITDSGVDTNGDGLYDLLVVHVPVVSVARGNVSVTGYISVPGGLGYVAAMPDEARTLAPGTNTWNLRFDGRYLSYANQDGPYTVRLWVVLPDLLTSNQTTYTTQAYRADQFEPGPATFKGTVLNGTLLDTNSDGRADFYDFQVPVTVREAGDYLVELLLIAYPYSPPPYTNIATAVRLLHLTPGSQTVDLRISGITMSRFDPTVSLRAEAVVLELGGALYSPYGGIFPADLISWTQPFPSGTFDARPLQNLTLLVASPPNACPSAEAFDPVTKFLYQPITSCSYTGGATVTLGLYPGTFYVAVASGAAPSVSEVKSVSVAGPTFMNVSLPPSQPETVQATVTQVNWNDTLASARIGLGSESPIVRFTADLAGNMDGTADTPELTVFAEYLQSLFYYGLYGSVGPNLLGVSVGNTPLPPVSASVLSVGGADSLLSSNPVTVDAHFEYKSVNDLGPAPKTLSVRVPYTDANISYQLTVDASSFDVGQTRAASYLGGSDAGFTWDSNAAVQGGGSNVWTVTPGTRPAYLSARAVFEFQVVLTGGPHASLTTLLLLTTLVVAPVVVVLVVGLLWWRRARKRRGAAPKA